jgi:hypothetical protein
VLGAHNISAYAIDVDAEDNQVYSALAAFQRGAAWPVPKGLDPTAPEALCKTIQNLIGTLPRVQQVTMERSKSSGHSSSECPPLISDNSSARVGEGSRLLLYLH